MSKHEMSNELREWANNTWEVFEGTDTARLINVLLGVIDEQTEKLDRLHAIVERLPVTADGGRVIPGDAVWHPQSIGGGGSLVTVGEDGTTPPEDGGWFASVAIERMGGFVSRSIEVHIDECYSTREAAEAARKEGTDDE